MAAPHIENKKYKLARIVVKFNTSSGLTGIGTGSGFFISTDGTLITCFHVIFLADLATIKQNSHYQKPAANDHDRYLNYFQNVVASVHAVHVDGTEVGLTLKKFDPDHDVAILQAQSQIAANRVFTTDYETKPDYGENINFVGFPDSFGYPPEKAPFAYSTGYVSAFPENQISCGVYEHIQMNAINLGGNSGGPLFIGESENVVGIVNGNMTMQHNSLAVHDANNQIVRGSFKVPLGIAYATSLKLLREKAIL